MKNIKTFDEFVNEAAKYNGTEMSDVIDKSDFGSKVKSVSEIKVGKTYIIKDLGLNMWMGDYKCTSTKSDDYVFTDSGQPFNDPFTDMTFSNEEIEDYVTSGDVYNQK